MFYKSDKKPNILISFFRYNISAIIATAVDFTILIGLTEIFQLWYFLSAVIGAIAGGIVAFLFSRNWVFKKRDGKIATQALKYILVWGTSIFLNTYGLYLFVEYLNFHYIISKVIVAVIIGIGFNFFMNKYFIFK
ncbi:MAG: GtrA family protein [Bacteroidales bacterium]|nr:GtrA family protein [Bacteroidales bacterium]